MNYMKPEVDRAGRGQEISSAGAGNPEGSDPGSGYAHVSTSGLANTLCNCTGVLTSQGKGWGV